MSLINKTSLPMIECMEKTYYIPPKNKYYELATYSLGINNECWSNLHNQIYDRIGQFQFSIIWYGLPMPNTNGAKVHDVHGVKAYVEHWYPFLGTAQEVDIPRYSLDETLERLNTYIYNTYFKHNPFRNPVSGNYVPIVLP